MQRLNGFKFYELGLRLAPLAELTNNTIYKTVYAEMWFARGAIRDILKSIPTLSVCRGDGEKLIMSITDVVPDEWAKATQGNMDREIGFRSYGIREAKETFEHVLSAELTSLDAYLLTQLGIYNTAELVERADKAFSDDTRRVISEEARKDFRQGGRCLAFELPTASGFHTMRATEAVLRQYYRAVFPTQTKMPEMAQCINELRKSGEDPKMMNILDSIRDLHRNPQMHPEAFLTMDEAGRLFDISKSAISAMADRIRDLRLAPVVVAVSAATPPIPGTTPPPVKATT